MTVLRETESAAMLQVSESSKTSSSDHGQGSKKSSSKSTKKEKSSSSSKSSNSKSGKKSSSHAHHHHSSSSKSGSNKSRTVSVTVEELRKREEERIQRIKEDGTAVSSCVKKQSKSSSGGSNSKHKRRQHHHHHHHVKFAVQSTDADKMCALIKEFQKVPERLHPSLWWTPDEMHERYERDEQYMDQAHDDYLDALDAVQCRKNADKDLKSCWDTLLRLGTDIRGCEAELCHESRRNIKTHRQAVLCAQKLLQRKLKQVQDEQQHERDDNDQDGDAAADNEEEVACMMETATKVIRAQSERFSRHSQTLANKMANLDHQACRDEDGPQQDGISGGDDRSNSSSPSSDHDHDDDANPPSPE